MHRFERCANRELDRPVINQQFVGLFGGYTLIGSSRKHFSSKPLSAGAPTASKTQLGAQFAPVSTVVEKAASKIAGALVSTVVEEASSKVAGSVLSSKTPNYFPPYSLSQFLNTSDNISKDNDKLTGLLGDNAIDVVKERLKISGVNISLLDSNAISDIFDSTKKYSLLTKDALVVVMECNSGDDNRSPNSDGSNAQLSDMSVYDFSSLSNGYPKFYAGNQLNSSTDIVFQKKLPELIIAQVEGRHFDANAYMHHDIVRFVSETILEPFRESNPENYEIMKNIIETSISTGGGNVVLTASPIKDNKIRDTLNSMLGEVGSTDFFLKMEHFEGLLDRFVATLPTPKEKAMLGYALGIMAKKGVLGYERNKNQANILCYSLASRCFNSIKDSPEIKMRDEGVKGRFMYGLNTGACMESLTTMFAIDNPFVKDAFKKIN